MAPTAPAAPAAALPMEHRQARVLQKAAEAYALTAADLPAAFLIADDGSRAAVRSIADDATSLAAAARDSQLAQDAAVPMTIPQMRIALAALAGWRENASGTLRLTSPSNAWLGQALADARVLEHSVSEALADAIRVPDPSGPAETLLP